jgi:hypothetical protein
VTLDELPGWARELVSTARVARLALLDEADLPRVLPVTFAVSDAALWTAIDSNPMSAAEPARVRRLRRRPAGGIGAQDGPASARRAVGQVRAVPGRAAPRAAAAPGAGAVLDGARPPSPRMRHPFHDAVPGARAHEAG